MNADLSRRKDRGAPWGIREPAPAIGGGRLTALGARLGLRPEWKLMLLPGTLPSSVCVPAAASLALWALTLCTASTQTGEHKHIHLMLQKSGWWLLRGLDQTFSSFKKVVCFLDSGIIYIQ